jgi:hypothetical protein
MFTSEGGRSCSWRNGGTIRWLCATSVQALRYAMATPNSPKKAKTREEFQEWHPPTQREAGESRSTVWLWRIKLRKASDSYHTTSGLTLWWTDRDYDLNMRGCYTGGSVLYYSVPSPPLAFINFACSILEKRKTRCVITPASCIRCRPHSAWLKLLTTQPLISQ